MLALSMELIVNFGGYQRDVCMHDAYTWARGFLNRAHYVSTTQTNGIKRLADVYWEDAVDVTHKAHQISPRFRKFAWSDENGVIDFRPEPNQGKSDTRPVEQKNRRPRRRHPRQRVCQ